MSRLTGTDAFNMMEAYNAVYAPQELTEEQVWEEVETWVNSLVEEGYDLSDYTWEEMYEEYLNEMGQRGGNVPGGNRPDPAYDRSRFARPMNAGTPVSQGSRRGAAPSRVSRPQIGSLPSNYRGAELQQTAAARASQVGTPRQGTAGGATTGGNTPIGPSPTRPAAPAARPAAPAARPAARPAAQAPARGTTRPTPTATTAPTPAPSAPRAKDTSITDMIGRSQVRQGATVNTGSSTSDARAIAARASVGATPKPAPTPAAKPTPRQARLNMEMEYDTFDTVLEYLVAEGYADTEEAALVIMANMSEEWKQSIVG